MTALGRKNPTIWFARVGGINTRISVGFAVRALGGLHANTHVNILIKSDTHSHDEAVIHPYMKSAINSRNRPAAMVLRAHIKSCQSNSFRSPLSAISWRYAVRRISACWKNPNSINPE